MGANRELMWRGATTGRFASFVTAFSILLSGGATGQDAAATSEAVPDYVEKFESREFESATGEVLRYRLLKPLEADPEWRESARRYPLIIFLHGGGECGDDNVRQLANGGREMSDEALRLRHPAFIIAPQCPGDTTWTSIILDSRRTENDKAGPLELTLQVVAALKKEFSIDSTRVYGVGLSMGADGLADVLHYRPKLLAGAVLMSGYGNPDVAPAIWATPVWVFHGTDDGIFPVDEVRAMVQALREADGQPMYTEYAGVGHGAWVPAFKNRLMWDWLFAQRRRCELVGAPLPGSAPLLSVGDLRGHREAKRQIAFGAVASLAGVALLGAHVRRGL